MTDLADAPVATDAETSKVNAALDALLAAHDPTATDNIAFRGARFDAGLAWVHFPEGHGGLAARPELNKLVEQRLREAGAAPTDPRTFFMHLAGPTIATHGSEEVKQRFLRPMFTGEEKWCQLFSEPGAGSDLAGSGDPRRSRRRRVDRQRAEGVEHAGPPEPTSGCWSPVPTPDVPKHRGITCFVLDMARPGSRSGRCARSPARPSSTRST